MNEGPFPLKQCSLADMLRTIDVTEENVPGTKLIPLNLLWSWGDVLDSIEIDAGLRNRFYS
jgi:hypothetical protein